MLEEPHQELLLEPGSSASSLGEEEVLPLPKKKKRSRDDDDERAANERTGRWTDEEHVRSTYSFFRGLRRGSCMALNCLGRSGPRSRTSWRRARPCRYLFSGTICVPEHMAVGPVARAEIFPEAREGQDHGRVGVVAEGRTSAAGEEGHRSFESVGAKAAAACRSTRITARK